jgi:hypothetical protein
MGLDDIVDKAKYLAGDAADKAKDLAGDVKDKAVDAADAVKDKAEDVKDSAHDAIHSEKAEHASDTVLDGAEKAANFVTGGKLDDKIGDIRDDVDAKIGDDEARAAAAAAAKAEAEKGGSGRYRPCNRDVSAAAVSTVAALSALRDTSSTADRRNVTPIAAAG